MSEKKKIKIDVDKILIQNPHIDRTSFETIRKELSERKVVSGKRAEYNLLSPFARHHCVNG